MLSFTGRPILTFSSSFGKRGKAQADLLLYGPGSQTSEGRGLGISGPAAHMIVRFQAQQGQAAAEIQVQNRPSARDAGRICLPCAKNAV